MVNVPLSIGFYTSQVVVWDFFHQQYHPNIFFKTCQDSGVTVVSIILFKRCPANSLDFLNQKKSTKQDQPRGLDPTLEVPCVEEIQLFGWFFSSGYYLTSRCHGNLAILETGGGFQAGVVFRTRKINAFGSSRLCISPYKCINMSKKSPTGPTERTPKPKYLIALATYLGVRW